MTSPGIPAAEPPEPRDLTGCVARLSLVASLARRLAQAGDRESLLGALTGALVPALGDLCFLYLADDAGLLRPLVPMSPPRGPADAAARRLLAYERDQAGRLPGHASIAGGGGPLVISEADDLALQRLAASPAHLDLWRGLGLRSLLCVPLPAPGAAAGPIGSGQPGSALPAHGLLVVGAADPGRYGEEDVPLGAALAAVVQVGLAAQERAGREAALRDRLGALTRAARELAHLLNNDLTMPIGVIELLTDRGGFSADVDEMLFAASKDLAALERHVREFQQLVRSQIADSLSDAAAEGGRPAAG